MEDLKKAIPDEEECESAFQLFDRDMNGDIACEEMELACRKYHFSAIFSAMNLTNCRGRSPRT